MTKLFFTLPFALVVASCNPYDPDLGNNPFRCAGQQPFCPEGYECTRRDDNVSVCEAVFVPDGNCEGTDGTEPNDNIQSAYDTGIPAVGDNFRLLGIELCPSNDVDLFKIVVETNNDIIIGEVKTLAGLTVEAGILAANQTVVAAATETAPGTYTIETDNLTSGVYFLRIRPIGGATGKYEINVSVASSN
ncbi:MAG: hypothetical protein IPL79_18635 [Myxococcales bacterium]|nr:hypothetical protein [Myxococcales bacterium]